VLNITLTPKFTPVAQAALNGFTTNVITPSLIVAAISMKPNSAKINLSNVNSTGVIVLYLVGTVITIIPLLLACAEVSGVVALSALLIDTLPLA